MNLNPSNAFNILHERGFIKDCTHTAELKKALEKPITFYLGVDPTADNLHIGHFFALQVFKILQDHGHHGILLIGNATAMIGDPSGKTDMRQMMTQETVDRNAHEIASILDRFIDTKSAKIVYNADWMKTENFVSFVREVVMNFPVAEMLTHDCYKNRLGNGLTLGEMCYMTMQANDFVHLNEKHNCTLQIGGSDQWANICAGVELGRKKALANGKPRPTLIGMCNPLLVKADGTKMGKTEKGVLWVSRGGTNAAYECYQHFINVFDQDVERLLRFFTDIPTADIAKMCKDDIITAKRLMAESVTKKIHGEGGLTRGNAPWENIPTEKIKAQGQSLVDILALTSIIQSKREAREMITGGAILIDNEKITDLNYMPTKSVFTVKKGKKTFLKIVLEKGE
ncbi:MAG: tyrosine--tRNA ligase [Christensenellaceae bacterium]|jgi:tyrosyl-tRNA synthetase|nr:tyrosine--tRNA ligase [Christensenellaceae bacterium]